MRDGAPYIAELAVVRVRHTVVRRAWIDPGYLSKLLSGEKTNPSRDTVIRLAVFGLALSRYETDDLLIAASYAPLVVERNRE